MLSGSATDPILYVASDERSKFVDVDTRMSPSITTAEMSYDDADVKPDLWRLERLVEGYGGDERLLPSWLLEQHLSTSSWKSYWYDGRLPSSTFPDDHMDGLSRDLWTLSSSSLLDSDDDDASNSKTLLNGVLESQCDSYSSHSTDTCTIDRCSSRDSTSVDVCAQTTTGSNGVQLAGSTSGSSSTSSRSSYGLDCNINSEPSRHACKRRRRRRHRRWSRGTTSRAQHITRHLCHGAHILRSLLLHSSMYGGYRSPRHTSAKSVSSGSDIVGRVKVGCHRRGRGKAAIPKHLRRTFSTPLTARRLSSAAGVDTNTTAIHRHCLEDHCYFNKQLLWKQAAVTDCSTSTRCHEARRDAWSARGSTMLELILRHVGPLQPNKGSVANLTVWSSAGGHQRSVSSTVISSQAKPHSAHERNNNSTVQQRRLLHKLLTGPTSSVGNQNLCEDIGLQQRMDNENGVVNKREHELNIATNDDRERVVNSCDNAVKRTVVARGLRIDDELQLSTNQDVEMALFTKDEEQWMSDWFDHLFRQ